jgi:hypothetical protein
MNNQGRVLARFQGNKQKARAQGIALAKGRDVIS